MRIQIRRLSVLLMLLLLMANHPFASPEKGKITIAIVDFKNTSGNSSLDYLEKSLPEMLITNLAIKGIFNIVERSRLQDAIKEMQLGMTGVVDQSNAVELGKAVGANAILLGSFLEISGVIRINARLIDVETSKVLKAESVQGDVGREIFNLTDQLANSIEAQFIDKTAKKTPPPKTVTPQKGAQKTPQPPPSKQLTTTKKGGSKTALYLVGGALLVGGGVAAAVLLGGKDEGSGNGANPNSNVNITVNIP